jgi:hypothetical protein
MEILDTIINFLNVTDNTHYIRKDYDKLIDKNEYLGTRIFSFLSILITAIAITFFISIIIFLIIK